MTPPRSLAQRVETIVAHIPRGTVATYGQVAALCGSPRAARQVGWILFRSVGVLPWQRVINREGRLSIVNPEVTAAQQAALLRRERVVVEERSGAYWVDLKKYLWDPESLDRRRHAEDGRREIQKRGHSLMVKRRPSKAQ